MELTPEQIGQAVAAALGSVKGKTGNNPMDSAFRALADQQQQSTDTFNDILRGWARGVLQTREITNYNGANMAFNHARDDANRLGLQGLTENDLGIAPFPGRPNQTNINIGDREAGILDRLERLADKEANQPQPDTNTGGGDNGTDQDATTNNDATADQVQPTPSPPNKFISNWLPAIASAGGLGTLLLVGQSLLNRDPEPTEPTPAAGAVGLEVEGVENWNPNSNPNPTGKK